MTMNLLKMTLVMAVVGLMVVVLLAGLGEFPAATDVGSYPASAPLLAQPQAENGEATRLHRKQGKIEMHVYPGGPTTSDSNTNHSR